MTRLSPAYEGDEAYVFVSYSHVDDTKVRTEIAWLQSHGINVWWDEGIGGGTHWRDELASRISGCQLFLFYVSPNSMDSSVCRQELDHALSHERPILLSHLTETTLPEGIAFSVSNRQALLQYELSDEDYGRKLLAAVSAQLEHGEVEPRSRLRRPTEAPRRMGIYLGIGLLASILGASLMWLLATDAPAPTRPPVGSFMVYAPAQISGAGSTHVTINRAGTHIYAILSATDYPDKQVYARPLSGFEFSPVSGSDLNRDLVGVFPSASGKTLVLAIRDGSLRRLPGTGGRPISIADTANTVMNFHGRWVDDETLLVSERGNTILVSMDGTRATLLEGAVLAYPMDDGDTVYAAHKPLREGGLRRIMVQSLSGGEPVFLVEGTDPRVTPQGHLLFFRGGDIWVARLTEDGLALATEPVIALTDVRHGLGRAQYEVADTGTMVLYPKRAPKTDVLWVSRSGLERKLPLAPSHLMNLALSPDESAAVLSGSGGLRLVSLADNVESRLVSQPGFLLSPVWLPGGDEVVFSHGTMTAGEQTVQRLNLKTLEVAEIFSAEGTVRATSVTADGQYLLMELCETVNQACDIGQLDLARGTVQMLLKGDANQMDPQVSPDGQFLAYSSDELGPRRILVRPYPEVSTRFWQVPVDDCNRVEWSASELFLACTSGVYSTPFSVSGEGELALGVPALMYSQHPTYFIRSYSETRDQWLTLRQANVQNEIVVVTDWFTKLDELIEAGQP